MAKNKKQVLEALEDEQARFSKDFYACLDKIEAERNADSDRYFKRAEECFKKHDADKPRTDLLSPLAMMGTAAVLTHGADKYDAHNWRRGTNWGRIVASLLRHTFAFLGGEDLDPDSGLPHVDHIGCNAMFLQELYRTHKPLDDRYKPEGKGE